VRRLIPLALAAVVLASGCGTERPGAAPHADPTPMPTPTPAPDGAALAGFPLALGLDPYADPEVTGPGRDVPGAFLETLCSSTAWPGPAEQRTDRLAVQEVLPDWEATRELVTYDTEAHATAVLAAVRHDVAGCTSAEGQAVTAYDVDTGFDAVTYALVPAGGDGTTLVQLVRVGRAVVAATEFTDPSGDDPELALDYLAGDLAPVTAAMACQWARGPCDSDDEAITFSPSGAGPFQLGMTVEQARDAAADVVVEGRDCGSLSWVAPSGVRMSGAFSPGIGLAYLSADRGATTDGVGTGDSGADLRAAYANLRHEGNGLWYSDQGETDYSFGLTDGQVGSLMVIADAQHCAS
jgi:hypothetical protein